MDKKHELKLAVIESVFTGKGYVLCNLNTDTNKPRETVTVTFHLSAWKGNSPPRKGQMVQLGDVQLFKGGWRASNASPITLEQ